MLMQRWMAPILISLALGGCCTDGAMCNKVPTSGPEMAWDGAGGQPPDRDVPARRPRRQNNEIIVGPLQGMATEPDRPARASAANNSAAEQPDEAAAAEAQLKDKIVICRGCMSKQPAARTEAASPEAVSANQ